VRVTARPSEDERPHVYVSSQTTLVVLRLVIEVDADTGELLSAEAHGYRQEFRGGPRTERKHMRYDPAVYVPRSLRDLVEAMEGQARHGRDIRRAHPLGTDPQAP
jgi:hypothetical protein